VLDAVGAEATRRLGLQLLRPGGTMVCIGLASDDTTLGFHESCHRADYLQYLRSNPLPAFSGRVGQRVSDFTSASERFNTAWEAYFPAMDAYSKQRTDEIGYTLSQCKADGKCK